MSHFSPSTPQSHSLFHSPSPFLVPWFLWLFIVGPLLYHKRGLSVAKRRGAPENQLQTDWRTTLNENEISVPWDTCLPPEEVPELLVWPKVEQKPRVIWEPTFPSPWGLMHFTKHPIPHSQALSPERITKLSLVLCSIPEPPCPRVVLPEDCSQPFHPTPSFQTFTIPEKYFNWDSLWGVFYVDYQSLANIGPDLRGRKLAYYYKVTSTWLNGRSVSSMSKCLSDSSSPVDPLYEFSTDTRLIYWLLIPSSVFSHFTVIYLSQTLTSFPFFS